MSAGSNSRLSCSSRGWTAGIPRRSKTSRRTLRLMRRCSESRSRRSISSGDADQDGFGQRHLRTLAVPSVYFPASPSIKLDIVSDAIHDHRGLQTVCICRNGLRHFHAFGFDLLHERIEAFHFKSEAVEDRALVRDRTCRSSRQERWQVPVQALAQVLEQLRERPRGRHRDHRVRLGAAATATSAATAR